MKRNTHKNNKNYFLKSTSVSETVTTNKINK